MIWTSEDTKRMRELADKDFEALAAEIHVVYCEEYEKRFGKPYWTNGDYSKLDEPTKNYDRNLVRWYLSKVSSVHKLLDYVEKLKEVVDAAKKFIANSVRGNQEHLDLEEALSELESKPVEDEK